MKNARKMQTYSPTSKYWPTSEGGTGHLGYLKSASDVIEI